MPIWRSILDLFTKKVFYCICELIASLYVFIFLFKKPWKKIWVELPFNSNGRKAGKKCIIYIVPSAFIFYKIIIIISSSWKKNVKWSSSDIILLCYHYCRACLIRLWCRRFWVRRFRRWRRRGHGRGVDGLLLRSCPRRRTALLDWWWIGRWLGRIRSGGGLGELGLTFVLNIGHVAVMIRCECDCLHAKNRKSVHEWVLLCVKQAD